MDISTAMMAGNAILGVNPNWLIVVEGVFRVRRLGGADLQTALAALSGAGEHPFVVTRYVPGLPLHRYLDEEGPMDEADALPLYQQLSEPATFQVPGTQIDAVLTQAKGGQAVGPFGVMGGFSARDNLGIEIFGLYWHFVDLVWVFVFTFFYLV